MISWQELAIIIGGGVGVYAGYVALVYMREVIGLLRKIAEVNPQPVAASMPAGIEALLRGLTDIATRNVEVVALLGKSVDNFRESVFGSRGSNYSDYETKPTNRRAEVDEIADLIAEHGLTEEQARTRVREANIYRRGVGA